MVLDESFLPASLFDKASLSGQEYAWAIHDIPRVIEAARTANLISIGGQLQFRLPAGICECYWVQVDTYRDVPIELPWDKRVDATARAALEQFKGLLSKFDFMHEGKVGFLETFNEFEAEGGQLADTMCFVWMVEAQQKCP